MGRSKQGTWGSDHSSLTQTEMEAKAAVNGGRIRKVTITEIENDQEWNWPDPGCFEEQETPVIAKTTDEVFDELEDVVQDWKKKLEGIVADGQKTIMKYLPGEALIGGASATLQARAQILSEWKED